MRRIFLNFYLNLNFNPYHNLNQHQYLVPPDKSKPFQWLINRSLVETSQTLNQASGSSLIATTLYPSLLKGACYV